VDRLEPVAPRGGVFVVGGVSWARALTNPVGWLGFRETRVGDPPLSGTRRPRPLARAYSPAPPRGGGRYFVGGMGRLMALPRHNKVASRLPLSAEDGHAADSIGTADFDPYETCDHAATSASMLSHCSGVEVPAFALSAWKQFKRHRLSETVV